MSDQSYTYLLQYSCIHTRHPQKIDQTDAGKPCSLVPLSAPLHQTKCLDEGLRKLTCVLSDDGDGIDVYGDDDNQENAFDYDSDEFVHHFELENQNTETESLSQVSLLMVTWEVCCSSDSMMNGDLQEKL